MSKEQVSQQLWLALKDAGLDTEKYFFTVDEVIGIFPYVHLRKRVVGKLSRKISGRWYSGDNLTVEEEIVYLARRIVEDTLIEKQNSKNYKTYAGKY